ncbi:MAG TPA: orotidine-5'-phosphate decarboxylase [Patescibacteria group bacterium]
MNKALAKLHDRITHANSLVCVGLDSDFSKLPEQFLTHETPQFAFNQWIIDQTHEYVAAYKLNLAFYEARGAQGWVELELTMRYLRNKYPEIFTIADAKRADIGSTNLGYVQALFDHLGFDAVTINPYLGSEAIEPFLAREDKVSIILCKTSNPGSDELQDLEVGGTSKLWQVVAEKVSRNWNKKGNCMMVVGATYPEEMAHIRKIAGDMPFLVPGIGVQGGDLAGTLKAGLTKQGRGLVINSARGIIFSHDPQAATQDLHQQINSYR